MGTSLVSQHGLQGVWVLIAAARGLSSCGTQAYLLHHMWDLSSLTKDQTHVSCLGRLIFNHWTTKGVPRLSILTQVSEPLNHGGG